jgi:hypothetical protein
MRRSTLSFKVACVKKVTNIDTPMVTATSTRDHKAIQPMRLSVAVVPSPNNQLVQLLFPLPLPLTEGAGDLTAAAAAAAAVDSTDLGFFPPPSSTVFT